MVQQDKQHGGWLQLRLPEKQLATVIAPTVQVAAAVIALKFTWGLVRGLGKAVLGHHDASAAAGPAHQVEQHAADAEEEPTGPPPTAAEQWPAVSLSPPPIPTDATMVAQGEVAVSVYQFYQQFLSCEGSLYQDQLLTGGVQQFKVTRWRADGEGLTRQFIWQEPKKGLMPSAAHCTQRQHLTTHPGDLLCLTTDMSLAGVPYCDAFRVQTFWRVVPAPGSPAGVCQVTVHVAVPFSKSCLMRGIICGTTIKENKVFFGKLIQAAQQLAGGAPQTSTTTSSSSSSSSSSRASVTSGVEAEVLLHGPSSQQQQQHQPSMLRPWGSAWTAHVATALTPPGVHPATAAAAAAKRLTQQSQQQQQPAAKHHLVHLSLQSSLLIVVVLLQLYILLHGRLGSSLCSGSPAHHLQWCAPALEQQAAELQDLQL